MKILFFEMEGCCQCHALRPRFEDLCKQHGFTNYEFVDVEENAELAIKHNVRTLPTLICIKENGETLRAFGAGCLEEVKTWII